MVKRIGCAFLWWLVFLFLASLVAEVLLTASTCRNPGLIAEAGEDPANALGSECASLLIFLGSLLMAALGTIFGILPGTAIDPRSTVLKRPPT